MSGRSEQQLREEISELRSELGRTTQELAGKIDVSQRAKRRAGELRDQARERAAGAGEQARQVAGRAKVAAGRAGDGVRQAPASQWAAVAVGLLVLLALIRVVRRAGAR